MDISKPKLSDSPDRPDWCRVSVEFRLQSAPGDVENLWFDFPDEYRERLDITGTAWVAALLPLACKLNEPVSIAAPVDAEFLDASGQLMEWWQFWEPAMKPVKIGYKGFSPVVTVDDYSCAQFFSGGVDSMFTLVRNLHVEHARDLTHLLIGHGFDIKIDDQDSFDTVTKSIESIAEQFDKTMLPFATNLRETSFTKLPWGYVGHGNAMAAVAILVSRMFRSVLVPSSDGYLEDKLWGSDPYVDHFYSTSTMKVVHEGSAFTRLQKIEGIAKVSNTLQHLRVCWRSFSAHNCGECEKCYRTMIAIDILGKIDEASSFPVESYKRENIRKIYCPKDWDSPIRIYYNEMHSKAQEQGQDQVANEIAKAKRRSFLLRPFVKLTQRLLLSVKANRVGVWLDSIIRKRSLL